MPIKFFGLPFTIDKTTHYQCAYGCKYYKSRAGSSKLVSVRVNFTLNDFLYQLCYFYNLYNLLNSFNCLFQKSDNIDFKEIKKKKRVGSKKMGCLAKMTIKHITVYPDYKLDVESDWRKKKKVRILKEYKSDYRTEANRTEYKHYKNQFWS